MYDSRLHLFCRSSTIVFDCSNDNHWLYSRIVNYPWNKVSPLSLHRNFNFAMLKGCVRSIVPFICAEAARVPFHWWEQDKPFT